MTSTRYGFVDLLRGFALMVMIEAHVVNAYLPESSRSSAFFFVLSFINGIVAPMFLFASGFSLILQVSRDWEGWLRFSRPFWLNLRRLGFITLVAYYTHVQHFKLSAYLEGGDPSLWRRTLQIDILQCIVGSLLVLQVLIFLCRKRSFFAWAAFLLASILALLTPLVWAQDFSTRIPLALALFMNPHGISFFPLFPWICFVLSGGIAAHLFLGSVDKARVASQMKNQFLLGLGMIAAGILGRAAPFTLPGEVNYFTTSPLYVLVRLGCVLVFTAGLYGMERRLHFTPRAPRIFGQESLLVYGVHLWLVFALLRGRHLGPIIGLEAGYAVCFLISAAVITVMLWLARVWRDQKKGNPRLIKRAQATTVLLMIFVFMMR